MYLYRASILFNSARMHTYAKFNSDVIESGGPHQ